MLISTITFSQNGWDLREKISEGKDKYRVASFTSNNGELIIQEHYDYILFCLYDTTITHETQTVIMELKYGVTTKTFIIKDSPVYNNTVVISTDLKNENFFIYLKISDSLKVSLLPNNPIKIYDYKLNGIVGAYEYVIGL